MVCPNTRGMYMPTSFSFHFSLPIARTTASSETTLVKIVNDLLFALDDGKVSVLSLLELSMAFDMIDDNVLLHRLEHALGITGVVLSWIHPHLSNRDQIVVVKDLKSEPSQLYRCP